VWWNTLGYAHRVWREARSQLQEDQKEFRALAMHRWHGHGPIMWPPHLAQEIPTFARWLLDHVRTQMANGVVIDLDVVVYSCPPSTLAYTYNSMWAYGNHYRANVETRPTHATYDNGVACIFRQGSRNFVQDKNIVMDNLHYGAC